MDLGNNIGIVFHRLKEVLLRLNGLDKKEIVTAERLANLEQRIFELEFEAMVREK